MKVKREWNDEPEVFERVKEALEYGDGFKTFSTTEKGPYGDLGTITIKIGARRFEIDLHEIMT